MKESRPLCTPHLPKPAITVQKMPDKWVIFGLFYEPYPKDQFKIKSFFISITLFLAKEKYRVIIEAPHLDGFIGKREEPRDLRSDGFLSAYDNWVDKKGVKFFHWLTEIRERNYLCPSERDLNGGKSPREIAKNKEREEIDRAIGKKIK